MRRFYSKLLKKTDTEYDESEEFYESFEDWLNLCYPYDWSSGSKSHGKCSVRHSSNMRRSCGKKCFLKKRSAASWIDSTIREHYIRSYYHPVKPCLYRLKGKEKDQNKTPIKNILQEFQSTIKHTGISSEDAICLQAYQPIISRKTDIPIRGLYESYFTLPKKNISYAALSPQRYMDHMIDVMIKRSGQAHPPLLENLIKFKLEKIPTGLNFKNLIENKRHPRNNNPRNFTNYHKIRPITKEEHSFCHI